MELTKPFSSPKLQLKNRVVMSPMTRGHSPEHIPGPDVAAYYARRAKGGVGLIFTEGTCIDHPASFAAPKVPVMYGEALEGWKGVIDAVHQEGGKIFSQLWHVGSVRQEKDLQDQIPGYAPSPLPYPAMEHGEVPHEMSESDIVDVIAGFARSARSAKDVGFDGIEIHGAHGYLIDQFLWDVTNLRQDRYGGKSMKQRALFAAELVKEVRKAIGPDFPISFRFSQWKVDLYDAKTFHSPKDLEDMVGLLVAAGVDLFHCSTRRFWEPAFPDSPLNLAGWTKKLSGLPVITVGSVGLEEGKKHFATLEKMLQKKEVDLVSVGRALLADPNWYQKIVGENQEEIVPFSQEALKTLF